MMAFKMVALFRQPDEQKDEPKDAPADFGEVEAFLTALPDVQRVVVGTVTGSPRGESPFSRIVDVYFESEAICRAALESPDMRAKGKSLLGGQGKMRLMFVEESAK